MLFVFMKTSLPTEHSVEELRRYEIGAGGALEPKFCGIYERTRSRAFLSW
jgi:hypothetical protein